MNARNAMRGHAQSQAGFTLLEVLVAFSLLAVGLGILLAILSGGVRAVANAADSTRASLYAQGIFATLGGDRRLQPGRSQGSFENGRYRWVMQVSAAPTPALTPPPGSPPGLPVNVDPSTENQLLRVVLVMNWGAHGALRVETLRAYLPAQAAPP